MVATEGGQIYTPTPIHLAHHPVVLPGQSRQLS